MIFKSEIAWLTGKIVFTTTMQKKRERLKKL